MATAFNDGYNSFTHPLTYSFTGTTREIESGAITISASGSAVTAATLIEHLSSALLAAGSTVIAAYGERLGTCQASGSGTLSCAGS